MSPDRDEKFRDVVDLFMLWVANDNYPSFQFLREAVDTAEEFFIDAARRHNVLRAHSDGTIQMTEDGTLRL